jgi:hypothetical protein
MKRLHVHVAVKDISQSIGFYSALFAAKPAVVKIDYAKWMLDDPRVNFAISMRGAATGINHLGLEVETGEELAEIHERLKDADGGIVTETGVSCCYAKSDKHWVTDPQGIAWETFRSLGETPMYHGKGDPAGTCGTQSDSPGCCTPGVSAAAGATDRKFEKQAGGCCAAS